MDVQRQEKLDFLPQAESEFSIPLPFCSMWAFNRLDNTHPHCLPKWYVCIQNLLILMPISSENTLTDIPRNLFIFFPAIWASLYVSSWHIKLTITPAFQVNFMVINKIQFFFTALETFKISQAMFEQTLGDSKGQESLVCCSLWIAKSQTRLSDSTSQWLGTRCEKKKTLN